MRYSFKEIGLVMEKSFELWKILLVDFSLIYLIKFYAKRKDHSINFCMTVSSNCTLVHD